MSEIKTLHIFFYQNEDCLRKFILKHIFQHVSVKNIYRYDKKKCKQYQNKLFTSIEIFLHQDVYITKI